jgi:hypothetical protein
VEVGSGQFVEERLGEGVESVVWSEFGQYPAVFVCGGDSRPDWPGEGGEGRVPPDHHTSAMVWDFNAASGEQKVVDFDRHFDHAGGDPADGTEVRLALPS